MSTNLRWKGTSTANVCWCKKTIDTVLSCGIKISAVCSFILSQSTHVMKGRKDRLTSGQNYDSQDRASIAAVIMMMVMMMTHKVVSSYQLTAMSYVC